MCFSGLIILVGYAILHMASCMALGMLTTLAGCNGAATLWMMSWVRDDYISAPSADSMLARRCWSAMCAFEWLNRFLKIMHWVFVVLTTVGAVVGTLQVGYMNPGTRIPVTLPTGHRTTISYNCTYPTTTVTAKPTIWFESSPAHGVLDFLGIQLALSTNHSYPACSYDPPNLGWSDALPASLQNDTDYLPALLAALGVQREKRVLVGWGGGLELVVRHAVSLDPNSTVAVIDLDGAPDGIEWADEQRKRGWSEAQRLAFRKQDLRGRARLAQLLLSLGMGL
ncbi:hypothetical protein K432DRAFT_104500 [Lepidopterella palustris CBS 459.81]|uniref:Uncharacterized protein n=1 Tax=Lepidopterella palustris CBS 459.81 TaxID=1314670 RepID=A0A8E2E5W3_9PEZI|nr:hypothetical protein K432DRAFT_104500 [Lepidopterella palustris CBS 459.81]